jgi:peptide/nickel transport system permease protein
MRSGVWGLVPSGVQGQSPRPFVCVVLFCFLGPFVWRVDPFAFDPAAIVTGPSLTHPLGTDALGRDALARLMEGGAETMRVAIPAAALAFVLGVTYGLIAGLGPAWLDRVLMRLLDAVLALPSLVVLICLSALATPDRVTLVLLIGVVAWPSVARLVRGEALAVRGRDFVLAADQLGAGRLHVARFHALPVMGRLLVVNATFLLGDAILGLSALSFLGLGVQPPATSWGQLLQEGMGLVELRAWWLILPPGLLIAGSLFAAGAAGRWVLNRGQGA